MMSRAMVAVTLVGLVLATVVWQVHFSRERALINLAAAVSGLLVALLFAWRKAWHLTATHVILIAVVALVGTFLSLRFHDNYSGGEYLYHIRLGFPFGWREGDLPFWSAVQQGISLPAYMAQHPEQIHWRMDMPALVGDLFFWMNVGILFAAAFRAVGRKR